MRKESLLTFHKVSGRFLLTFLLLLAFAGCCCTGIEEKRGYWERKIEVEPISKAIIVIANKLRHEKGLRFEDSTVYYDEFVDGIRVIFSSQAIVEVKEARELVVDIMETIKREFNNNPVISSQFEFGEISAHQIELYISFESSFIEYVDQEYVAWASVTSGVTRFQAGVLKDPWLDYWHNRTEPYYKSLEFVTFEREAEAVYDTVFPPQKGLGPAYDVLIQ